MSEQTTLVEVSDSQADSPDPSPQTTPLPSPSAKPIGEDASGANVAYWALMFRDGLDMPIDGLTFIATYPSGFVCTAESTSAGAIALPVSEEAQGDVKIEVRDSTGKPQPVCSIDQSKCGGAVIVRSPKTKAKVSLQPHQQVVPAQAVRTHPQTAEKVSKKQADPVIRDKPQKVDQAQGWWGANGSLGKAWAWLNSKHFFGGSDAPRAIKPASVQGLSSAGQPVAALIGPEAPNKENLRLGRNNIYRQQILDASKRLGLIPQALCALLDCEAGKVMETIPVMNPDGTPAKDKKGCPVVQKVHELWNANAGNAESGAAGLTQFLASTWLTHVLIPGYYIHEKSVANGWVKQVLDAKGKKQWMFVLADGTTTMQPYAKRQTDANVKKCLAMRMDPAWSINAAADYGNTNLKVLERAGFKLSGLNDMERAKIMYLMHHEGEGCGPLFVKNKLRDRKDGCGGVERLKQVFIMQLGKDGKGRASELIDQAGGNVEKAYRRWLSKYIDKNFLMAEKYFFKNPVPIDELSVLMDSIGGEAL